MRYWHVTLKPSASHLFWNDFPPTLHLRLDWLYLARYDARVESRESAVQVEDFLSLVREFRRKDTLSDKVHGPHRHISGNWCPSKKGSSLRLRCRRRVPPPMFGMWPKMKVKVGFKPDADPGEAGLRQTDRQQKNAVWKEQ